MIKKSLFAGITTFMMASTMLHAEAGDDLYKTQRGLLLQDSVTTLPFPISQAIYPAIEGGFYISGSQSSFVGDYFLTGYTNLDSPANINPFGPSFAAVTIYDTTNNMLDKTDSLTIGGLGLEATAISAVSERPFIVLSTFTGGVDALTGPFGPYILKVYAYDPLTGTIERTGAGPVLKSSFNFASLNTGDPATVYANSEVISYNGAASFSHDSKYVFYTSSISFAATDYFPPVDGEPVPQLPAVNMQRFGVLAIDANGVINPTPVVEIDAPSTNVPGFFYYPQPDVQTIEYPEASGNYKILVTYGSFFPATNAALALLTNAVNSIVVTYDFNPNEPLAANRLKETGFAQLPQLVRAGHFNATDNILAVITSGVVDGPSIRIGLQNAFPGAEDPKSELRFYKFDPTVTPVQRTAGANALSYEAGHHISGDGWNVKWSNDHSMLALTMTQLSRLMTPAPAPVPASLRANAPSMLNVYSVKNEGRRLILEDTQPVAPSALNLSWSLNDKLVATTGRPTPQFHDAQLFEIVDYRHE